MTSRKKGDIEWPRMEQSIRSRLELARTYIENDAADAGDLALILVDISDAVGFETGRGYVLDDAFLERFGVS